jgi:hypothetical protein
MQKVGGPVMLHARVHVGDGILRLLLGLGCCCSGCAGMAHDSWVVNFVL